MQYLQRVMCKTIRTTEQVTQERKQVAIDVECKNARESRRVRSAAARGPRAILCRDCLLCQTSVRRLSVHQRSHDGAAAEEDPAPLLPP